MAKDARKNSGKKNGGGLGRTGRDNGLTVLPKTKSKTRGKTGSPKGSGKGRNSGKGK